MARLGVADGGLLMNQQRKLEALRFLDEDRSSPNGDACLLQKIVGKGTDKGSRSGHEHSFAEREGTMMPPDSTEGPDQLGRYL